MKTSTKTPRKAAPAPPALKSLYDLTREEHAALLASGKLFHLYPTAGGDWERDCFLCLSDLGRALNDAHGDWAEQQRLYQHHFQAALVREGLTEGQAAVVHSEAYDRGHSSGYSEVVIEARGLVDFVKAILNAREVKAP